MVLFANNINNQGLSLRFNSVGLAFYVLRFVFKYSAHM